ncbi:metallophosphoesterase family protein [Periweissella cryptocerci]|nr:DNA repair exonuclease [Periweissella cryptocerci]
MKFIHAADVHLGNPFNGLQNMPIELLNRVQEATTTAFERMIDDALSQRVDFVLLPGDLFDSANQSVTTLDFLGEQFERLYTAKIPVYLSYGNHDFMADSLAKLPWPANVHVFGTAITTEKLVLADGTTVAITGFSYPQRHLATDMAIEFPLKQTEDFQIGMYHGTVGGNDASYAATSVTELLAKHYDYWALGHIHKRQVLHEHPTISYSGNIQGHNEKETGAKGYLLVKSENGELLPVFIPVAPIIWEQLTVDVVGIKNQGDLVATISAKLVTLIRPELQIFTVTLIGIESLSDVMRVRIDDGTTTYQVNQQLITKQDVVWVNGIIAVADVVQPQIMSLDNSYWEKAASEVFNASNIHQIGLKNLPDTFITSHFDDPAVLSQLQQRARQLMNATIHGEVTDED